MPRLGKYELLSRIAQGGQAETFRAQLEGAAGVTKQVVIKKVLPAYAQDEAFVAAFIGEAKLSAGLSHGNIAQVFEFGQVDGDYFLAMEWVDGKSLAEALTRSKELEAAALPVPLACFLAIEVCKALHYAHGKGIVHRDVSPENILIGYEGQTKVIDFGIAKAAQAGRRETEPGLVKGKFLYFSPEQAHAQPLDGRSDVFALGIVLYRMLSGVMPFSGQLHEVIHAIQHGRFKPIGEVAPGLSPALTAVVMKALAKQPADRFASALELQQALTAVLYAEDAAFSSETVKDWMAWLFTGQKTARLDRQLRTWAGAALPPQVKTEPAAEVTRAPGGVPWLALGVAAGALAVGVVAFGELRGGEPEPAAAPALLKPAPDVTQKPATPAPPKPAAVRDAMVYPGTAVLRADRHRIRLQGLALPAAELKPGTRAVVEKNASGDDSPLFLQLSGGETLLALQQPTALPAGTTSARAYDLRPFGDLPRGATRTLDFSGQALTFADGAAVVDARNAAWFSVAGLPADKRVRLTLRALEPEQWKGRPRPASVVVVWKRAFGRLPPPAGSVWPDEVDRAVLTAERPLVVEHATELVMAFADELARDEKDSVLVELFDTGEPASRPDPAALAKVTNALLEKTAPPASKRRPVPKTVEVGGPGADQLFDEALTFFERGQHARARPKLEQCIAVAPKDFECHKLLGSVLTQLGETRRAIAAFREFVRLAPPGDPDVPKVKALIQLAEGRP